MPAIIEGPDGPRTYGELAGDAHQLVHLFRSLGAHDGDAIGVLVDNGNTLIETSLACHESGIHFIPLNVHLTAHELAVIMEHSQAKVLVIGDRFADLLIGLEPSGLHVLAVGAIPGVQSLAETRAGHPRTIPDERRPGGLFVYTSGTTGKPKGIRRPIPDGDVGQVANDGAIFGRAFDFQPFEGPMLVSTGMFHGGSHSYYMGGLHAGHSLVIMAKFDPEKTLRLIERHQVRTGYMVPTQFHRLLQLPDDVKAKYDVTSLHAIVHSAAPCPLLVKQQMMAWWGPVIWETEQLGCLPRSEICMRWPSQSAVVPTATNSVSFRDPSTVSWTITELWSPALLLQHMRAQPSRTDRRTTSTSVDPICALAANGSFLVTNTQRGGPELRLARSLTSQPAVGGRIAGRTIVSTMVRASTR